MRTLKLFKLGSFYITQLRIDNDMIVYARKFPTAFGKITAQQLLDDTTTKEVHE